MLKKEASRESKMCHFFGSQKKKKNVSFPNQCLGSTTIKITHPTVKN